MRKSAFTLIELLIVVAIIGILAAIAVPNFLNAQVRAKVSRAVSDLKTLETAMEMYKLDHGDYATANPARVPGSGDWFHPNVIRYYRLTTPIAYIASVPIDPFYSRSSEDAPQWGNAYDYVHATKSAECGTCCWGHWWRINSWGPDARNHFGGCRDGFGFNCNNSIPNFKYQSSNGLTSRGDIVWVGPKDGRSKIQCRMSNGI